MQLALAQPARDLDARLEGGGGLVRGDDGVDQLVVADLEQAVLGQQLGATRRPDTSECEVQHRIARELDRMKDRRREDLEAGTVEVVDGVDSRGCLARLAQFEHEPSLARRFGQPQVFRKRIVPCLLPVDRRGIAQGEVHQVRAQPGIHQLIEQLAETRCVVGQRVCGSVEVRLERREQTLPVRRGKSVSERFIARVRLDGGHARHQPGPAAALGECARLVAQGVPEGQEVDVMQQREQPQNHVERERGQCSTRACEHALGGAVRAAIQRCQVRRGPIADTGAVRGTRVLRVRPCVERQSHLAQTAQPLEGRRRDDGSFGKRHRMATIRPDIERPLCRLHGLDSSGLDGRRRCRRMERVHAEIRAAFLRDAGAVSASRKSAHASAC